MYVYVYVYLSHEFCLCEKFSTVATVGLDLLSEIVLKIKYLILLVP